jgi:hypothetical protein
MEAVRSSYKLQQLAAHDLAAVKVALLEEATNAKRASDEVSINH